MITEVELAEAQYNARDVLATCRVWPHLVEALEQTDTVQVYEADEQMAELALQMTRIGLPVNSERRAEIGARLRVLRDAAIEKMRPYTEGEHREAFLGWVATFFAAKARKGEPTTGSTRIGPTRAAAEHEEARAGLAGWKQFRKDVLAAGDQEMEVGTSNVQLLQEADETIAAFEEQVKVTKQQIKVASFDTDENDGLIHTAETALELRCAIRRAEAELAISKKGVNFGAKVQQCAILRAAGVPLHKKTTKSGLPQIDKEVLEGVARHQAAKALLSYILTEKTINVYIEGEKRAGKGGGKSKPVMVTEDGYIHPLWGVHRITGRWNSSPNCQNWSVRAGGGAENLRAMIEAPEGYVFVSADQAQLEARLIAAMSGCKYMLDTFQRGDDIHAAFAAVGFPQVWPGLDAAFKDHKKAMPKGEKCKCPQCLMRAQMRDVTKRLEYGAFYGGKEQTLFESIVKDFPDSTLGQVHQFLVQFNTMLPEVLAWRQRELDAAIANCLIRSPILGRRQVFPLGRVDPNVVYNYEAQSGGADIWILGAIAFMKLWPQDSQYDVRLIQNGHDSVLILCRVALAPRVEQDVYTCWNMTWRGVPFMMESKICKRWSGD